LDQSWKKRDCGWRKKSGEALRDPWGGFFDHGPRMMGRKRRMERRKKRLLHHGERDRNNELRRNRTIPGIGKTR